MYNALVLGYVNVLLALRTTNVLLRTSGYGEPFKLFVILAIQI